MPQTPMTVGRALLIGHLAVNGPVLVLILVGVLVSRSVGWSTSAGVLAGAALGWLWWSIAIPRWRTWALGRGADSTELQRLGAKTGLVWPKGWLPEKTELPPRDQR